MSELLRLPVAARYPMRAIVTYRGPRPVRRLATFAVALVRLTLWCLGPGPRLAHVHATVRGSLVRKSACVLIARALGRPVLLHVHAGAGDIERFGGRGGPLRRRAIRAAFRRADAVLAVSDASAAQLRPRFGRAEILVVPNPAPELDPPPTPTRRGGAADVELLYLGGFEKEVKGGDVLLAALPDIASACPGAVATLAGPGEVPSVPVGGGGARWVGWLDRKAKGEALARADILLVPSRSEGMPVAVLEGMAAGLAIVATRVGGIPELLEDGRDALLVEPDDPPALATAAIALARDPARRRALGEAARARAGAFDRNEVSATLERLYASLLGG